MVDLQKSQKPFRFRAGIPMSVLHRSLRRSVLGLLCMLPGICAAQSLQFLNVPAVELTGGRVSSFATGIFQSGHPGGVDMLYINTATGSGTTMSVAAGVLLNNSGQGFRLRIRIGSLLPTLLMLSLPRRQTLTATGTSTSPSL